MDWWWCVGGDVWVVPAWWTGGDVKMPAWVDDRVRVYVRGRGQNHPSSPLHHWHPPFTTTFTSPFSHVTSCAAGQPPLAILCLTPETSVSDPWDICVWPLRHLCLTSQTSVSDLSDMCVWPLRHVCLTSQTCVSDLSDILCLTYQTCVSGRLLMLILMLLLTFRYLRHFCYCCYFDIHYFSWRCYCECYCFYFRFWYQCCW